MANKEQELIYSYTSDIIIDVLNQVDKYTGETFVIKYDGAALDNEELAEKFAQDIVMLKKCAINPIVVHGGGSQLDVILKKFGLKGSYIEGVRVTDQSSIEMVEMALSGLINKQIVKAINKAGGIAVGISGKDGNLIEARKARKTKSKPHSNIEQIIDLGFAGEPVMVNPEILASFEDSDMIPVISPIGIGENGETYNLNPSHVSTIIAASIAATKLILFTDEKDIFTDKESLLKELSTINMNEMLKSRNILEEMQDNLRVAMHSLEHHIESVHIINGSIPHSLLLEIFTKDRIGIMFHLGEQNFTTQED